MNPVCRMCGIDFDPEYRPSYVLESLGVQAAPSWLQPLCNECLNEVARHVPTNEDGYPIGNVEQHHLDLAVAEQAAIAARRVIAGLSIVRCEAFVWSLYGERDHRCVRFSCGTESGHLVCGHHRLALRKGREVRFVSGGVPARPYLIWARSADELLQEGKRIAQATFSVTELES